MPTATEIRMMRYRCYQLASTALALILCKPLRLLGFTDVAPNYFYVEDGEIKVSYTQDGWREGLAYMAKLYAEGLMDPECFVADAASAKM